MNFKRELAEKVIAGEKTVTRRLVSDNPNSPWWREKCRYRVGQEIAICPGRGKYQIGKAVVVSVERMALGVLSLAAAQAEGFRDRADFEATWTLINGTYDPWAVVWRVGLEAVRA